MKTFTMNNSKRPEWTQSTSIFEHLTEYRSLNLTNGVISIPIEMQTTFNEEENLSRSFINLKKTGAPANFCVSHKMNVSNSNPLVYLNIFKSLMIVNNMVSIQKVVEVGFQISRFSLATRIAQSGGFKNSFFNQMSP